MNSDRSAYIVSAVRTPVGRRGGGLADAHPADLAAHVLRAVVARADVDPVHLDDVIVGCVDQVGAQASNIARTAVLSAEFPESVPANNARSAVWVFAAGGPLRRAGRDEWNTGSCGCSGCGGHEPGAAGVGDYRWARCWLGIAAMR